MADRLEQTVPRPDVVAALRERAAQGASTHELAAEVRARLGHGGDAVVPVLFYFAEAFYLRLPDVLPLRESLLDVPSESSDRAFLSLIRATSRRWMPTARPDRGGRPSVEDHGLAAAKHEG